MVEGRLGAGENLLPQDTDVSFDTPLREGSEAPAISHVELQETPKAWADELDKLPVRSLIEYPPVSQIPLGLVGWKDIPFGDRDLYQKERVEPNLEQLVGVDVCLAGLSEMRPQAPSLEGQLSSLAATRTTIQELRRWGDGLSPEQQRDLLPYLQSQLVSFTNSLIDRLTLQSSREIMAMTEAVAATAYQCYLAVKIGARKAELPRSAAGEQSFAAYN